MTAHPLQILVRRPIDTPDVIADLTGEYAVDDSLTGDHADRRQTDPQASVPNPARPGDHTTGARLLMTTADFLRHRLGEVHSGLAVLQDFCKRLLKVLVEMRLILLHGQQVLAFPLDDPGGDLFLTAHGIDRHHGPFEILCLE